MSHDDGDDDNNENINENLNDENEIINMLGYLIDIRNMGMVVRRFLNRQNNENNEQLNENNIDIAINNEINRENPNDDEDNHIIDDNDNDDSNSMRETSDTDDYETVQMPNNINFDIALPSSHNYLGDNFEDVLSSKIIHEQNDIITLPILPLPGNAQLLPGQVMPVCVYAPLQVNFIKNRIENSNGDPIIGFIIKSDLDPLNNNKNPIGIIGEILSCKNEDTDINSLAIGLMLKIRGGNRFKVLRFRHDITGCTIADVSIMSEYVLDMNPLKKCFNKSPYIYDSYLNKNKATSNITAKIEYLNTTPHPAWLYRQYDCNYLIDLILNELKNSYDHNQLPPINTIPNEPKLFSNWLLANFPFDDQFRLNILKLDCINQRLRYIYSILKHYSCINCRTCRIEICNKSDIFTMCTQGFMNAYVNPNGHIHETLTVYKAKNLNLIGSPSTQFCWFPGYAWTICQCKQCGSHIGWKYTAAKKDSKLIPEKFWGLTRNAVCHTNDAFDTDRDSNQNQLSNIQNDNQLWLPMI